LAIVTAVTSLAAQQPQRPATRALPPGGTGIIVGQVVDGGTSRPVPDTMVWLLVGGIQGDETPRVMTDAEGRFFFLNVPAGRYGLHAQKIGYLRGTYAQKAPLDAGRDLEIADGQFLTDIALPIWKYAAIGGTVTDEHGEPVVGVTVYAFRKMVTFSEIRFTPAFRASFVRTDDRGIYRIATLVPGEYAVGVPSTMTTFPADIMPDVLSRNEIRNETGAAIREIGVLGDASNQQLGSSVLLTPRSVAVPPAPTPTDIPATYRTTFYPAATRVSEASVFALASGEERSGVDLTLKPVRAVRVSGQLLGPDGPMGPTAIRLIQVGESPSPGFETATAVSDAAGRFTLLGVPEGQYFLWVEKRRTGAPLLAANESVTVGTSNIADLIVNLRPAPRITVRLDVRGGKPDAFQVLIEPIGPGGFAEVNPDAARPATVELPPGRYVVIPNGPASGPWCTTAMVEGRDVSDELLNLGTENVDVIVTCGDTPTRLSGTTRSERGTADPETLVVVFPTDRRFWSGAGLRPRRFTTAKPSSAGAFSVVNLPPGDYFVAALPIEASDFWQDPKRLDALTRLATRVSLAQAETRTTDLQTVRVR
jgi:hypothetical protein